MPPRARVTPMTELAETPRNAVAIPSALALTDTERHGLAALDVVEQHCTLQAISTLASQAERSIVLAKAIKMAEDALEPFKETISALKCTPLGFMLDKPENYDWPILRRVIAEGMLRGARITGNEINGISKRCYLTQAYFVRKVRDWPGLTITNEMFSIPRTVNGQTVVDYRIDYEIFNGDGNPTTTHACYERQGNNAIPIRVNDGMGADAILGKAKRKAYAGLLEQLLQRAGQNWSPGTDGEIDDERTTGVQQQPRQVQPAGQGMSRFPIGEWINRIENSRTTSQASTAANLAQVGRDLVNETGLANGLWTPQDISDFCEILTRWLRERLVVCTDANGVRSVQATLESINRIRPLPEAFNNQCRGAIEIRAAAIAGTSPGQATVPPGQYPGR